MKAAIERMICSTAAGTGLEPFRWILMSGSGGEAGKLVWLGWVANAMQPAIVAKAARSPLANRGVRLEYEALVRLQHYLSPGMKGKVPTPLGLTERNGSTVMAETAVPGKELRPYLHARRAGGPTLLRRLGALAGWVLELGRRSSRPASEIELKALLFDPMEEMLAGSWLSMDARERLAKVQDEAVRLASTAPLPLVFCHNDLGTPNVTANKAGRFAGIVDWEFAAHGLPATDLIYFLGRFAYEVRGSGARDELRGFKEMFFRPGPVAERRSAPTCGPRRAALSPERARSWLLTYCARLGVDFDWLPVLFAVCWVSHALKERRDVTGRDEDPAAHGFGSPAISPTHFLDHLRFYLRNPERLAIGPCLSGRDERRA